MFKKHPGNIRAAYNVADEPTRVVRGSEMVEQGKIRNEDVKMEWRGLKDRPDRGTL